MMKSISIVIVNWNTGQALKRCLDSIEELNKTNYKLLTVVIVDNASTDNSLECLDTKSNNKVSGSYKSLPIKLIQNKSNEGFAKACNEGAREADGDYILFLNPDMMLFKNTLKQCFSYLNKNNVDRLGAFGVKLVDDQGNTLRTCSRLPKKRYFFAKCIGANRIIKKWNAFMLEWNHESSRKVDEVIGAFFIVPRHLFEEMKSFDERFFVYYEEVDYCKRLKDKGYYVYYYADASAFHEGGGSSNQVKDYRLFYELRSRYLYEQKHYGDRAAFITLMLIYLEYVSRFINLVVTKRKSEVSNLRNAYRMLSQWRKSVNKI